ncbi:senecionine N-oxygenase [Halyomorpha halys]|uniref:senecionine N-oxygenase n=1 Tax=Halyomorpha halys TaxID=286706 RepID=UPI0006D4D911|nr:senecionine N-oxygenase isoform X2 [Halyomorpha halys]
MEASDKSCEKKDSKEEDMELCAAPVRPQPTDVKPMESFTEQFFKSDLESTGAEGVVESSQSEERTVTSVVEEKTEIVEGVCTIKTSLVTEKIQSFSESFHASLKLNERVDSSNDTCPLDIEKIVKSEPVASENESPEEVEKEEKEKESKLVTKEETKLDIKEETTEENRAENKNSAFIENEQAASDEKATSEEVVSQIIGESKNNVEELSKETENASPKAETEEIKNTQNETKKADNSLYPTVFVKREDGKEVEAIECKEIKKEVRIVEPPDVRRRSSGFVAERDITSILEDANAVLSQVAEPRFQAEPAELRVAVVGAGPAGLCAARHLVTRGFRTEVYEQCPDIGGTWVYSEEPLSGGGHPYPLHSSLYHDLWTNLPKEAMRFPDFDYPDDGTSYLPSEKILQYLVDYADNFNLHPAIKVKHQVKRVAPVGKGWSVTVEDLTTKKEDVSYFDAVMVCSGPNNVPVYPLIEGIAKFSGKQIHSRDYRRAETYTDKRVLIVGLGPSGLDITYQLAKTAKQVILSHNKTKAPDMEFPPDVILKPKVASLFDKTVTFADETTEEVDVVIYCTGYTYNFPFLTEDCGIIVDQYVGPLYKHLINIERPTMCIIGLPKYCPHQYMVDYQVRAYLNILLGESKIPSKEEMQADLEADIQQRNSEGQRKKDYHKLSKVRTQQYMDDLAKLGNLEPVEPVMFKLFHDAFFRAIRDFKGFRKYLYKIVDKENYEIQKIDEKDD